MPRHFENCRGEGPGDEVAELMLEIGWKSFRNRWPCYVFKLLKIILHLQLSLEVVKNLRQSSEVVGRSSEVVGNLRKPSVNLRKFRFCADERSQAFYRKKVGRYSIHIGVSESRCCVGCNYAICSRCVCSSPGHPVQRSPKVNMGNGAEMLGSELFPLPYPLHS